MTSDGANERSGGSAPAVVAKMTKPNPISSLVVCDGDDERWHQRSVDVIGSSRPTTRSTALEFLNIGTMPGKFVCSSRKMPRSSQVRQNKEAPMASHRRFTTNDWTLLAEHHLGLAEQNRAGPGFAPSPQPSPQKGRGRPLDLFDQPRLPEWLFHRDNCSPSPLLGRGSGVRGSRRWCPARSPNDSYAHGEARGERAPLGLNLG